MVLMEKSATFWDLGRWAESSQKYRTFAARLESQRAPAEVQWVSFLNPDDLDLQDLLELYLIHHKFFLSDQERGVHDQNSNQLQMEHE